MICNCGNCFHSLLDYFRVKSKVRLISEISEFWYLALGQIRKLGNLGKIFSQSQEFFELSGNTGKICERSVMTGMNNLE